MQADDYRISIIITSYNKRDYLVEAVDSVIAQTLRPHEIIIADDGSGDGSRETIRSYMDRYPGWIRGIFQEQNVGIPKNRNAALRTVTGNYVGILDGDDLFLPSKLEKQVAALRANPDAKVVYSNFRRVEEDGTTEVEFRFDEPQPQGDATNPRQTAGVLDDRRDGRHAVGDDGDNLVRTPDDQRCAPVVHHTALVPVVRLAVLASR